MHKRGRKLFLASILLVVLLSSSFVIAQESSDKSELSENAGITPDSAFYFVEDSILTKFRDDSANREKKIAEVREMIKEGKVEEAKKALAKYKEFADRLEKEVSPDKQDEAKRSAEAIRAVISEIESEIPESDKEDFIDSVVESEKRIETAAEIASKIKDLCETLAKVDPDQYSRTCKTDDDSPAWQKKLDKDLTDEQKKEAKVFIQVMTQCFKDATQCKCQDITVKAFADKCSEVAPLYAQCQKGDESKCEEADKLSEGIEDLLPDYLQEIMAQLDEEYSGAQFENHMPEECREANAKTEKECMQIMVRTHAPEECISALDSGKIKFENEKQFRKECEEIMFNENAPQECIDAGIKDGRECGKFMFKESAPQECIDAGLTGDKPSDGKKCREIMDKLQGGRENKEGPGRDRPGFNFDCRKIENSEERLKCFDSAVSSYKEGAESEERRFNEADFRKIKDKERQCADSCKGGRWDFSGGECQCNMEERREEFRQDFKNQPGGPEGFKDSTKSTGNSCLDKERSSGLSYDEARVKCFGDVREEYKRPPKPGDQNYKDNTAKFDCSKLNCGPSPNYCDPWGGCQKGEGSHNPDGSSCPEGQQWSGSGCVPFNTQQEPKQEQQQSPPSTDSSGSSSSSSSTPESSPPPTSDGSSSSSSGSGITGGVIVDITSNSRFLQYFFNR